MRGQLILLSSSSPRHFFLHIFYPFTDALLRSCGLRVDFLSNQIANNASVISKETETDLFSKKKNLYCAHHNVQQPSFSCKITGQIFLFFKSKLGRPFGRLGDGTHSCWTGLFTRPFSIHSGIRQNPNRRPVDEGPAILTSPFYLQLKGSHCRPASIDEAGQNRQRGILFLMRFISMFHDIIPCRINNKKKRWNLIRYFLVCCCSVRLEEMCNTIFIWWLASWRVMYSRRVP